MGAGAVSVIAIGQTPEAQAQSQSGGATPLAKGKGALAHTPVRQPHWPNSTNKQSAGAGAGAGVVTPLAEGGGSDGPTCRSPRQLHGSRTRLRPAMLRLAAKVVAFFWRRADSHEEETGLRRLEPAEGASRAVGQGRGCGRSPGGRPPPGRAPSGQGRPADVAPSLRAVCTLWAWRGSSSPDSSPGAAGRMWSVLPGVSVSGKPQGRCRCRGGPGRGLPQPVASKWGGSPDPPGQAWNLSFGERNSLLTLRPKLLV